MKRFIKFILILAVLYLSYQGWQKYILQEEGPSIASKEDPLIASKEDGTQSELLEKIGDAVGALQSSIKSLVTESNEQAVPASAAKVSQSNEVIVDELVSFIDARTPSFIMEVYGEREVISSSMEIWIEEALSTNDYARYALQSYKYSIIGYSQFSEVSFDFQFRESEEQTNYVRSFVKDLLATNNVAALSDHEKIKWIHDWIVTHVQYDQSLTRYTAYEALTEKLAVCQGYALLGHMLLQEAGFEVRIAEGEVNTGSHAWNMVKLDNVWYHIDFTWDDPIGQAEDEVSYRYYLVSDDTLRSDHSWIKAYPVASVDYKEVLNQAILETDGQQKSDLIAFRESLQLHWFESDYTIANKEALTEVIVEMTKQKQHERTFRYLASDTLINDLKQAFKKSNTSLSYNVQYAPFSDDGSSLVTVSVTYH